MRPWVPPRGPLGELVAASYERARRSEGERSRLADRLARIAHAPSFAAALRSGPVAIVAEVKRRSPSQGPINEGLVAADRARGYAEGGAAAISVLTEPERFGGSLADLESVRAAVTLPLLRKDFITSEIQLLEARVAGASAVLLIARGLEPSRLAELAQQAEALGLDRLVEVRDEIELELAVGAPGAVIGVNARDLETLAVDRVVAARLVPLVPRDRIVIHESGVRNRADVEAASAIGADAVLVGSAVSSVIDGKAAVRTLVGVVRRARD